MISWMDFVQTLIRAHLTSVVIRQKVKSRIISIAAISIGILFFLYGVIGIEKYGFYISVRGDHGRTEGGLSPLFILIGLASFAYGIIEFKLHKKNNHK